MPSAQRANAGAAPAGGSLPHEPIPIVDALPPGPRERLLGLLAHREIAPGDTFMHEGDVTKVLSIIVRGRVALRLRVPERGAVTILTLDPGDIVGWSAIVPPYRATTSATALEPTELASFPAEELRAILGSDAEVAAAFLPPILETVAARVAATRDQLLDLFRGAEVDPW
ncbi:MAG: cyclic nucleotide-binding domain-containing protein [Chloroflexota bacterium]